MRVPGAADSGGVTFARSSLGCTLVVILLFLAQGGSSDWSRTFAIGWFALLGLAAVCSLVGVGSALFVNQPLKRRVRIAVLSLPAPLVVAPVTYFLFFVLPHLG
jgi:hypothetical protein